MKLGLVSDTHMMKKNMDKIIPYLKKCNLIIHAGDNFADSKYLYNNTGIDTIAVKGNCDFENVEDEITFDIEGKKIFVCHGDKYDVKSGINVLKNKANKINADIVIFGHTHTPLCVEDEGILFINPGSASFPRGVNYKSFVILDINDTNIDFEEVKL